MKELWDRRIPPAEDCVLAALLERRAPEMPDKVFVVFEDEETWTYAQMLRHVRQAALACSSLACGRATSSCAGCRPGANALKVWFALNYLGAVYVPINLAYRGGMLEHVVANTQARFIVVHPQLADVSPISIAAR